MAKTPSLKASARLDSTNGSYIRENVHVRVLALTSLVFALPPFHSAIRPLAPAERAQLSGEGKDLARLVSATVAVTNSGKKRAKRGQFGTALQQ